MFTNTHKPPCVRKIDLARPLVSVWTVLSLVAEFGSEDDVLAAVEDGRLLWAFDLSGKGAKCRLVRILAASVADFVEGNQPVGASEAEQWAHIGRLALPTPAPTVPARDVALAWSISGTHLLNLCDQGLLRLAKGTPRHSGPGGSPQIERQSAMEFLKSRRVM